jgi:hypothetical protein
MIGNKPIAFSATSVPSCSKSIWLRPMTALGYSWLSDCGEAVGDAEGNRE